MSATLNMATDVAPIPWVFTDSPGLLQWAWVTEHLAARIVAQSATAADSQRVIRHYHWELSDRMRLHQGMPRMLIDGDAGSFETAEEQIREHAAKCYDPRLGYRRFAGSLAFTFELSTGQRQDVSTMIGREVTVTVLSSNGSTRTLRGDFDVRGYRWILASSGQSFEVVPEHVVSISDRSIHAHQAAEITRPPSYSGIGRIHREEVRAGCTGRPGFMAGTVDHAGSPRCPLHEVGLPDHLLH
jgi:hypothetical protein